MSRQRFFKPYFIFVVAAGAGAILFSLSRLSLRQLNWQLLFLAIATAAVSSRLIVKIPHSNGDVTIADTLIFLTMMLYGGEAAILLAAIDGLSSSLYVSKKLRVCAFNVAQMALSTLVTVWTLHLFFGSFVALNHSAYSIATLGAICVMATVQYICNSGLVTIYTALKTNQPLFATWHKHYLWTSISYFAGASVASIAMHVFSGVTVYAMLIITPIVMIIYVTYRTYLKNVQVSAQKAEEARYHADENQPWSRNNNQVCQGRSRDS